MFRDLRVEVTGDQPLAFAGGPRRVPARALIDGCRLAPVRLRRLGRQYVRGLPVEHGLQGVLLARHGSRPFEACIPACKYTSIAVLSPRPPCPRAPTPARRAQSAEP